MRVELSSFIVKKSYSQQQEEYSSTETTEIFLGAVALIYNTILEKSLMMASSPFEAENWKKDDVQIKYP